MPAAALLDEALDAWADARRGFIAELRCVPAGRVGFRPASGAPSVAEIAWHVVDTALMWCGELSNPAGDFTRQDFPAFLREYGTPEAGRPADRSGLVRLLQSMSMRRNMTVHRVTALRTVHLERMLVLELGYRIVLVPHGERGPRHREYFRWSTRGARPNAKRLYIAHWLPPETAPAAA